MTDHSGFAVSCASASSGVSQGVYLPVKATLRNLELLVVGSYLATGEYILSYRCLSKHFRKITGRSNIACGHRTTVLGSTAHRCWVCQYTSSQLRAIADNTGRLVIDLNTFITPKCGAHSAYRQVRMLLTARPLADAWSTL